MTQHTYRHSDMDAILDRAAAMVDAIYTADTNGHALALSLFADLLGGQIDDQMFRSYATNLTQTGTAQEVAVFYETIERATGALLDILEGTK